jgi:hypothetical protein
VFVVDETSATTAQKQKKVIAQKGLKKFIEFTSAERGKYVTLVEAMCVAPTGTHGLANPTDWHWQCYCQIFRVCVAFLKTLYYLGGCLLGCSAV